jgi:hypothetical protein
MKPYMEPKMRRKMGAMDAPPAQAPAAPMDEPEGGMGEGEAPAEESNDSKPTAFLSKEMGGGKQWKPGDEIVLKVDAVDPETGELQVSYASDPESSSDESPGPMESFDQSMPAENES